MPESAMPNTTGAVARSVVASSQRLETQSVTSASLAFSGLLSTPDGTAITDELDRIMLRTSTYLTTSLHEMSAPTAWRRQK